MHVPCIKCLLQLAHSMKTLSWKSIKFTSWNCVISQLPHTLSLFQTTLNIVYMSDQNISSFLLFCLFAIILAAGGRGCEGCWSKMRGARRCFEVCSVGTSADSAAECLLVMSCCRLLQLSSQCRNIFGMWPEPQLDYGCTAGRTLAIVRKVATRSSGPWT